MQICKISISTYTCKKTHDNEICSAQAISRQLYKNQNLKSAAAEQLLL